MAAIGTDSMFAAAARRLSGLAGAMLGWRPAEFWAATPAELAEIFDALRTPAETPLGGDVIAQLQEQFPDG